MNKRPPQPPLRGDLPRLLTGTAIATLLLPAIAKLAGASYQLATVLAAVGAILSAITVITGFGVAAARGHATSTRWICGIVATVYLPLTLLLFIASFPIGHI